MSGLRDALRLRDAAIRALLAEGWSVREVAAIERRHVLARRVEDLPGIPSVLLYLRGRGLIVRGEHAVVVAAETADAIYAYLATRVDPLEPLFLSERRRRISADTVWRIKRQHTVPTS